MRSQALTGSPPPPGWTAPPASGASWPGSTARPAAGTLAVGDASKLANVLQILGRMIETGDLEVRLDELERRAEVKG